MNRERLCKSVQECLVLMGTKLKLDGSINWQDSALISEDTFCELLNTVFEYQLVNANSIKLNAKGYDLVDKQNGLCFQVTKDASRSKIQETLDKVAETGGRWHVRFLLLVEKHPRYRTSFDIPAAVEFDESNDLIDLEQLLKIICFAPIATLEEAERILRTNIEYYPELQRAPSTLAAVVKALSAVKLKDLPLDQRARFCIAEKIRANSLERGAGKIMRLAPYIGYVEGPRTKSWTSGGVGTEVRICTTGRRWSCSCSPGTTG